jgi:hypothetical protein
VSAELKLPDIRCSEGVAVGGVVLRWVLYRESGFNRWLSYIESGFNRWTPALALWSIPGIVSPALVFLLFVYYNDISVCISVYCVY